jgi:WD40 repeat protein
VDTGRLFCQSQTSLGNVRSLAFAPDGKTLAAAGHADHAALFDANVASPASPGMQLMKISGSKMKEIIQAVRFSPVGKQILLGGLVTLNEGSYWSTFYLLDLDSGKRLHSSAGPKQPPRAVPDSADRSWPLAFSPDGKTWVGATWLSPALTAVTRATGQALAVHLKGVTELAFTPDGKRLVSAGLDGVLRVTELAGGKEVGRLTGQGALAGLALSPDGKKLAWATAKGVVKVRHLAGIPAPVKKKE